MELQQKIKAFLDKTGWSKTRLAQAAGLNHSAMITKILKGQQKDLRSANYLRIMAIIDSQNGDGETFQK